jgi:hypothetical protein
MNIQNILKDIIKNLETLKPLLETSKGIFDMLVIPLGVIGGICTLVIALVKNRNEKKHKKEILELDRLPKKQEAYGQLMTILKPLGHKCYPSKEQEYFNDITTTRRKMRDWEKSYYNELLPKETKYKFCELKNAIKKKPSDIERNIYAESQIKKFITLSKELATLLRLEIEI